MRPAFPRTDAKQCHLTDPNHAFCAGFHSRSGIGWLAHRYTRRGSTELDLR